MRWLVPVIGGWCLMISVTAEGGQAVGKSDARSDQPTGDEVVAINVRGITDGSTEDNPGVLYILPWQPPTLPRRTREALDSDAPELREPLDPTVFQRHRNFQHSMNPRSSSSNTTR